MNKGLQIYQQPQIPAIQANNSYALALTSTRQMFELTHDEKYNLLMDCVTKATFIGGWHSKLDHEIELLIEMLIPEFDKRYKRMTQAEVSAAFDRGAKGQYGDTPGISVKGILRWIDCYYLDRERQSAKKQLEKSLEQPARPKMSRGEKRAFINSAYQKFLQDGFYKDYGNAVYDLADNERLIVFTNAEKRAFLERGRKIVFDNLQNYKNLQQKRDNEKKLDALIDNDNSAIFEAKRIALYEYFKILKSLSLTEVPFINDCPKL